MGAETKDLNTGDIRVVDNRGLACPQPVLNTKRALEETGAPIICLVDNEAARDNVSRFARSQGYEVAVTVEPAAGAGRLYHLLISRPQAAGLQASHLQTPGSQATRSPAERPASVPAGQLSGTPADQPATAGATGGTVVFIGGDRLGRGSDELGGILMRSFLFTLTQLDPGPTALFFVNAGVNLTTEGSPVLSELQQLQERGTEILSCGTCLDFFHLKEKLVVGRVTNMYEIAERLTSASRLIQV